jgi:diguanylate cyclase (GGDEF)-like protein
MEADMNRGSWRWYLLVGAVATMPIVVIPDSWWYTAWYDTIGPSAVAAVLIGVRGHRPRTPITWWWLAAGQLLFVVGDLLFDLHERVWHTDAFPSSADSFYLAGYVPLAVGLVLLIRARTPGRDRASLIDATIIATGLGLLSWVFLMKPVATDSTLTVVGRVIAVAYPAADVLLLALVARLLVGAGVHNTAFRLLAGSLSVMLVGDVGFAVLAQADAFTPNNAINTTWLLAYVLFGAAALHPSMTALSQRAPERPRRLTRRRLSLLTGVSLVAPILLLAQAWGRDGIDAAAIGIGSIALFLLVVARMAGLIRQVEQQAAQLEKLAERDPLTGAANRRAWDRTLPVEMDRARRAGTPLAVALLDLDHFKRFNDQYGHQAGDQLLKIATAAWQSLLRSSDLLARYGGEEFAVLLPSSTLGQAVEVVGRLLAVTPLAQTFSAGVALWHGDETSDQIVARADQALYQAKEAGRNQVLAALAAPGPNRVHQDPAHMAWLAEVQRPSS